VWAELLPAPAPHLAAQYHRAVWLVAGAGVLQMLAEPAWVAGQLMHLVRLRVVLDTVWVLTRVVALCLAVTYCPDRVVEAWAAGHALAGLLYVLGHYVAFHFILRHPAKELPMSGLRDLLPTIADWSVDPAQWTVATSFLGQGVVKQLLTEGEKYVMTVFSLLSLPEQGIYDVVSNLGSLAARFVFRPVEESSYFFFSQLWERPVPAADQPEREKVGQGLHRLLRLMLLLGLLVFGLGFSYCHLLLLFLSVNGVTECFARAAMTEAEIHSHTRAMSVLSGLYLLLAWLLTAHLGPVGFTFANCVNMAVRIVLGLRVVRRAFPGPVQAGPLAGLLPDNDLLLVLAAGAACCQASEVWLYAWSPLVHLAVGLVTGTLLLLCVIVKEDFVLAFLVSKLKSKTSDEDEEQDDACVPEGAEKTTKQD
jgi:oligosaccharide translocation protein RFT1